jgi:hypothetical protein
MMILYAYTVFHRTVSDQSIMPILAMLSVVAWIYSFIISEIKCPTFKNKPI